MSDAFSQFTRRISRRNNFRFFLMKNLPAAWLAGCRLEAVSTEKAVISLTESWLNRNPFRSIYFAALNMAAELSTGVLCMGHLYEQPPCSMLIVKQSASYFKKATGTIRFLCEDGDRIAEAIQNAIRSCEATLVHCNVRALNSDNELVAEMQFSWSFKARNLERTHLA